MVPEQQHAHKRKNDQIAASPAFGLYLYYNIRVCVCVCVCVFYFQYNHTFNNIFNQTLLHVFHRSNTLL